MLVGIVTLLLMLLWLIGTLIFAPWLFAFSVVLMVWTIVTEKTSPPPY